MRKRVGIATSVIFSGGYFAYLAEDGRTLGGLGWLLTGFVGYWIGAGLVEVFESVRGSGPQPTPTGTMEAGTRASGAFSRHRDSREPARSPEIPQAGSRQISNRPNPYGPGARSQRRPAEAKPGQSETDVDDWLSKLERLSDLRERGFLTEEEFNSQKRALLPENGSTEEDDPGVTGSTDQDRTPPAGTSEPAESQRPAPKVKRSRKTVGQDEIRSRLVKPGMKSACKEMAARSVELYDGQVRIHFPSASILAFGSDSYLALPHVQAFRKRFGTTAEKTTSAPAGFRVSQWCGNPRCVNPEHLSLQPYDAWKRGWIARAESLVDEELDCGKPIFRRLFEESSSQSSIIITFVCNDPTCWTCLAE